MALAPVKKTARVFVAFCLGALLLFPAFSDAWGAARIAVLLPEVREPYSAVFQSILRGIESRSKGPVLSYALPEEYDPVQVETWLWAQQPSTVIALGSRGLQMAQRLKGKTPVLVGAVLLTPGSLPGISMAADPAVLFGTLKRLAPQTRRVIVIYDSSQSEWLIAQAKDAARQENLQLMAQPVEDLRQAVTAYRELSKTLGSTDAVWLTTDDVSANERAVLPLLLEAAWDQRFILFSSKPAHAKQGALFSLVPDHVGMGRSLADMADGINRGRDPARLIPTKDLQLAVNLRTAAHLGLSFSAAQQDSFALKFP